jgi:PKD repeat protein
MYPGAEPLWQALYAARADVVVNAHRRLYERFAPQTPAGSADAKLGLRQFIAGTGGQGLDGTGGVTPRANSEKIITGHYGVLRLTLDQYTYRWEFVSTAGGEVLDTGEGVCHGRPGGPPVPNQAPTASAGGPYAAEATVTFNGSGSSDVDADLPLTYAWSFGDGTSGTGVSPTKTYGADGVYTATLVVTDAKGLASAPATATVTITNQPPVVNAGADATIQIPNGFTLGGTFTDAGGAADGPWTWTVAWGDGTSSSGTATAQGAVTPSHTYASWGEYTARLTVRDKNGAPGSDDVLVVVRDPSAVATLVGAGDIAGCDPRAGDELTADLLDGISGTVFTLGDNAYVDATLADFQNCYNPSWGRHKARTKPVPGNHEYEVGAVYTADGYFDYFGAVAGERDKGYYSYTAGEWLVIALNSSNGSANRSASSAQVQWLKALLASTTRECVVAYMHHPQFTSAQGRHNGEWNVIDLWNTLYEGGVELVIASHDHLYDRFAPMRPDGTLDPQYGIRQITVGTGGFFLYNFGVIHPNSQARSNAGYGVLKLTLRAGSYDWDFVPVAGNSYTDHGSGSCHGRPGSTPAPNQQPTANAGGPYAADNTIAFSGSGTDPDGNLPLTYAWTFHDGSTSTLANPTKTYATNGAFTATLRVKDALGLESAPATATVTIANVAPTVNAGADAAVQVGTSYALNATFTDPGGAADAPWSWSIVWGDGSPAQIGTTSTLGGPIAPAHTFAAAGSYTVQVTVTDKDGGSHTDNAIVTATATPVNSVPSVNAGADADATVGSPYTMNATFTDPDGAGDGPWTWTIQWGDGATATGTASAHGGPISASHAYMTPGPFTARLTVTDKNAGAGSDEVIVTVAPGAGPLVLAGAGNIARCDRNFDEATGLLLDGIAGTVFTMGDNVYNATATDFQNCYGPSWGRHAARTRPAPGEIDYAPVGATGYFGYFGASAGDPANGYYSYDLGSWHVVVLNTSKPMTTGSAQEQWLKADLAANTKACVLAYWHFPRFSSYSTAKRSEIYPLWSALYAAGADVVVNGHYRLYERFGPQNPDGGADPTGGIRQFTVGTGGQGLDGTGGVAPRANSEKIVTGAYGVLKLTLDAASYSWQFISTTGQTLDSGTTACH